MMAGIEQYVKEVIKVDIKKLSRGHINEIEDSFKFRAWLLKKGISQNTAVNRKFNPCLRTLRLANRVLSAVLKSLEKRASK